MHTYIRYYILLLFHFHTYLNNNPKLLIVIYSDGQHPRGKYFLCQIKTYAIPYLKFVVDPHIYATEP